MDAAILDSSADSGAGQLFDNPKKKAKEVILDLLRGKGRAGLKMVASGVPFAPKALTDQGVDALLPKQGRDAEMLGELLDPVNLRKAGALGAAGVGQLVSEKTMQLYDPDRVRMARRLIDKGASEQDIWSAMLAWFPKNEGMKANGQRRGLFHVNTEGAQFQPPSINPGQVAVGKMRDFLKNVPELDKVRPDLLDTRTFLSNDPNSSTLGFFNPDRRELGINLGHPRDFKVTAAHELNHLDAGDAGMAPGSNPAAAEANAVSGQNLPDILNDLTVALMASGQAGKYGTKAARKAGMVDAEQMIRGMQRATGVKMTAQQALLASVVDPQDIQQRITDAKFMLDRRPAPNQTAYFNADEGEGGARLSGELMGKNPEKLRNTLLADLLRKVNILDPNRLVDTNAYSPTGLSRFYDR